MSVHSHPLVLALTVAALGLSAPAAQAAQGSLLSTLYGCDAQGSGNTTGAVVGGLVGALAGSQVSKNERALGAVIGAGLGSAIGNNIGCRMDRKSQQDAQLAFRQALDTGRPQSWSDPRTGASGRIEVLGPAYGQSYGGGYDQGSRPGERWRYAEGVSAAIRVSASPGTWAAKGRINMRSAPSASAAIVDRLQPGERFDVAGTVAGGWLAVTENGLVQGYVAQSVAQPVAGGYPNSGYGQGQGYAQGPSGECRLVQHTLSEPGRGPTTERYNACRDPSGEWRLSAT